MMITRFTTKCIMKSYKQNHIVFHAVMLLIKYPNHPEKDTWEERSNYWLNYYRKLGYMEPPIETTFKVYEAIGSFAAEYLMVSELEKKLRLTQA